MADLNFTPESRLTIRDRFLAYLQARHAAAGRSILVARGSYEYKKADVLALELSQFYLRIYSILSQVLPDRASGELLERFGSVNGIDREQAIPATIVVTGTGTASSTITPGASRMRSSSGYLYVPPASINVNGLGAWTATFTSQDTGLSATPLVAGTLQWDTVPANSNPLGTVSSITTSGADQELDADYAARIIAAIRERPASGNRSDIRRIVQEVSGVTSAFVYPLRHPGIAESAPGCWTAVPLGPADGDTPVYPLHPRLLSITKADEIVDYLEGVRDANGAVTDSGEQLRHVGMIPSNMSIEVATPESADVVVTLETTAGFDFEYQGVPLAVIGSTLSTLTVAGDHSALVGKRVLVFVGAVYARGGYMQRTITAAPFGGVNTVFTLSEPLPLATSNDPFGACVYGVPANWSVIKNNIFAYFDSFGPNGNGRWPNDGTFAAGVSEGKIIAAAMAAQGSRDATVAVTGASTPSLEFGIVTLRYLVPLRA